MTAKELRSYADPKTLLVTGPRILFVTEPTVVGRDGEGAVQLEEPKMLFVAEPKVAVRDGEGASQLRGPKDVVDGGNGNGVVRDEDKKWLFATAKELRSYSEPKMLFVTEPKVAARGDEGAPQPRGPKDAARGGNKGDIRDGNKRPLPGTAPQQR